MGAFWQYRVAKDEQSGKLHFVYARYRSEDPTYRCGLMGMANEGDAIEEMRRLAKELLVACGKPIIPLTEYGDEDNGDDNVDQLWFDNEQRDEDDQTAPDRFRDFWRD